MRSTGAVARVDLLQRSVECAPAGRAWRERLFERFALVDELLTREQLRARDRGRIGNGVESPMG